MAPTDEEWARHKNTIRCLFLQFSLAEAMARMRDEHSFVASKTQYEKHFRQWRFRKNLSHNDGEWTYILNRKRKRDQLGKDSEVLLHGVQISEKTIKKRLSRYTITELEQIWNPLPEAIPPSPEYISIRTPTMALSRRSASPALGLGLKKLQEDTTKCAFGSEHHSQADTWLTTPIVQNTFPREIETQNLPYVQCSNFIVREVNALSGKLSTAARVSGVNSDLDILNTISPHAAAFGVPIISNTTIIKFIAPKFGTMSSISSTSLELQDKLRSHLDCLYLERDMNSLDTRLCRLFGPYDTDSFQEFHSFVMYFASNNMGRIQDAQVVLEWLLDQGRPILKRMLDIQLPTVQQFLGSMVDSLIRMNNTKLGKELLEATNQRLFPGHPEKLLLAAVKFNCVELVMELLDKLVTNEIYINSPPYIMERTMPVLVTNCASQYEYRVVPITLLGTTENVCVARRLLEVGADVNALHYDIVDQEMLPPVKRAARKGNRELVHLFMQYRATLNEWSSATTTLFGALETRRYELVSLLLDGGARTVGLLQETNHPDNGNSVDDEVDFPAIYRHRIKATELQLAVHMGHLEIISRLLRQNTDELRTGEFRWVPLRDAAKSGNLKVVRLLLASGADVNASSDIDHVSFLRRTRHSRATVPMIPSTPLLAAVEGGHLEVVRFLLSKNANVNAVAFGTHGSSALEAAKKLNSEEISRLLRSQGAVEVLPQTEAGRIIGLKLAAKTKDIEKAKVLVAHGVDPAWILDIVTSDCWREKGWGQNSLAVFLAVCGGDFNIRGVETGLCPLEAALRVLDFKTALRIVSAGGIPEDTSSIFSQWDLLESLPPAKYPVIVRLLLELCRISSNTLYLGRALQFATLAMDMNVIQHLATLGADVNTEGWGMYGRALSIALIGRKSKDSCAVIEYLVSLGADVNADFGQDTVDTCRTPLQLAAANERGLSPRRNKEIVQLLLDKGARINEPPFGIYGRTALQAAASSRNPSFETIKLLLDNGADINAPPAEEGGYTALQGAAMKGYLKIAFLLLERGADPNALGAKIGGVTALEGAAENGHLDMVQLLLNAGANKIESAAKKAEIEGQSIIADLLRERPKM